MLRAFEWMQLKPSLACAQITAAADSADSADDDDTLLLHFLPAARTTCPPSGACLGRSAHSFAEWLIPM